ncbi:MAG: N-acetylgalactosamine 6-sulfate sulfatase, partial [Verrucomicrobia bacterium]|nr:N-acetylgalactosamine 6-sulfate sulfatase [Verrucomicrobiota bacterium]
SMDILGTMVALTGVKIAPERPLDGVNLLPFLSGIKKGSPHDILFWQMFDKQHSAVRRGSDKLIVMVESEGGNQLYQLSQDIGESHNRIKSDKATAKELKRELDAWTAQIKPAIFDPLGTWDP